MSWGRARKRRVSTWIKTHQHTMGFVIHNGLQRVIHTYTQPHPDTMQHRVITPSNTAWPETEPITPMGIQHNLQRVTHNSRQALKLTATPGHHTHDATDTHRHLVRQAAPRGTHGHLNIVHTQAQTLQSKLARHLRTQTATPRQDDAHS